jgi:hypothetical protein
LVVEDELVADGACIIVGWTIVQLSQKVLSMTRQIPSNLSQNNNRDHGYPPKGGRKSENQMGNERMDLIFLILAPEE